MWRSKFLRLLLGAVMVFGFFCGVGCGSAYAASDLATCIRNGYFGSWSGGSNIETAIEAIYGICNVCSSHSGVLYVGVWPNGSNTSPYSDKIEVKAPSSSTSVYLWSQMLNCGSGASIGYNPTFRDLRFTTTGFVGSEFPYIQEGYNVSGWNNLSSSTYGSGSYQWYGPGGSFGATFNSQKFASDMIGYGGSCRDVADYRSCTYEYTTRYDHNYKNTHIVWGYDGIAPYNISLQTKQVVLTGVSIYPNGDYIGSVIPDVEDMVEYDESMVGKEATVVRRTPPTNYIFKGWREERTGDYVELGTSYSKVISKNTIVYMVYEKDEDYVLTAESVDTNGGTLNGVSGLERRTSTAKKGQAASVTRGANDEYKFICWKASSNPSAECLPDDGDGNPDKYTEILNSNVTVYAVYKRQEYYTLTAKSVDMSGGSLSTVAGLEDRSSGPVEEGMTASVSHGTNVAYKFVCWKEDNNASAACVKYDDAYSRVMNSDFVVYAVYQKDVVEAMIEAYLPDGMYKNGYTVDAKSERYEVKDCSPVDGCIVSFRHYLKGSGATGAMDYVVARRSNYDVHGVDTRQLLSASFDRSRSSGEGVYFDNNLKLYPGQVVCETLEFSPYSDGNKVTIESCASATGYAQPLKI